MLTISNPFYQNPEANARQLLQQQIQNDAQRRLQQSLAELFLFKSLLSQGELCLCIPLHSFQFEPIPHENWQFFQFQQAQPIQPTAFPIQQNYKAQTTELTKETKLCVYLRNREHQNKICTLPSGNFPLTDECKLKADCIEIVVNLRAVLPAEISVVVEESFIKIEVNRVDKERIQNMWRYYNLPACVQVEAAKCILSQEGLLYIIVPWCKMES